MKKLKHANFRKLVLTKIIKELACKCIYTNRIKSLRVLNYFRIKKRKKKWRLSKYYIRNNRKNTIKITGTAIGKRIIKIRPWSLYFFRLNYIKRFKTYCMATSTNPLSKNNGKRNLENNGENNGPSTTYKKGKPETSHSNQTLTRRRKLNHSQTDHVENSGLFDENMPICIRLTDEEKVFLKNHKDFDNYAFSIIGNAFTRTMSDSKGNLLIFPKDKDGRIAILSNKNFYGPNIKKDLNREKHAVILTNICYKEIMMSKEIREQLVDNGIFETEKLSEKFED